MSTKEVRQYFASSILPLYSVPVSQTFIVTPGQSVSQETKRSSASSAEPLVQDLSSLVSNALIWACNANKKTLTHAWLRAAHAFSYQHKQQDISMLDANLLSSLMALQPSQTPCGADHEVKLSHKATRMLVLFVAKICKDSLPDGRQSHLDVVYPGYRTADQHSQHVTSKGHLSAAKLTQEADASSACS